jgi:16S rRNA (uracil1498-N3)-methyltransferase
MPVFYTNQVDSHLAVFGEEESRHMIRVLRMKQGDHLELVDGAGNRYRGDIQVPDPKACRVSITDRISGYLKRGYALHVAIAPPKHTDRFEWFLEKATEIGVDEITPLLCERSERTRIRHDRSGKILIAAMKQSGRALLPKLNQETRLEDFLEQRDAHTKLIAHCRTSPDQYMDKKPHGDHNWIILIGPEGDFSGGEIKNAIGKGYREISLGEAVYRTETAGIMACHLVSLLYRDKP